MKKNQRPIVNEPWYKKLRAIVRNRFFKDRLFKRVFSEKKHLLALYNALNNSNYTNENDLEVVTMDDVIFLRMKNDLSFIIGNTLNLYEHQSTVNNNIALRVFLYFAKQYEALVGQNIKKIYKDPLIQLPFPQCVVFYNGNEKIADDSIVKLSDAFILPGNKEDNNLVPAIECTVRILNINYGHNREIAEKCRRLNEYSRFIQIVKDCDTIENDKNRAMEIAVDKGIEENLLLDILISEKAGVKSMLLTEFNERIYKQAIKEEAWEEGIKEGKEEGLKQGKEEGLKQGKEEGLKQGMAQGIEQGIEQGMRIATINLVNSNAISPSVAAKNLNMTEEEFLLLMESDKK